MPCKIKTLHLYSDGAQIKDDQVRPDPGTDEEQQVNSCKAKPVAKHRAPSKLPWITRHPVKRPNSLKSWRLLEQGGDLCQWHSMAD